MGTVVVDSSGDLFTSSITVRSHAWIADEPVDLGGADRGPTPNELFLASIGACAAITIRMYAQRKAWPLTGVRVEIGLRRMEAGEFPGARPGVPLSEISSVIEFFGALTEEQKQRLLEIAGRCPVKRMVEGEVLFKSTLVQTK